MAEFQSQERVEKKEYDETLCEWELDSYLDLILDDIYLDFNS